MSMPPLIEDKIKKISFFSKFVKYYFAILLIFVAFLVGLFVGQENSKVVVDAVENGKVYNTQAKPDFLSKDANFKLFWEVWDIIQQNYVRQPVSETELLYGAMAGSVASLNDPHSVFFTPQTATDFAQELKGNFEGIGAEIAIKNDRVTIVAPLPGSPAEAAGLKSGDKIYAIDGEDTNGISLDYAVNKIRGPKGSTVVLTISRDGLKDLTEYTITRDKIKIESVKLKFLPSNIAHLELRYFNEDTTADFNEAILEIIQKNSQGVILDMRNNPGGYLDTAVAVASEWVDDGVIVSEKSSTGELRKHYATGNARLRDFPTIILVNKGSASGSEIVAGALKDLKVARLVGEKTFGKGSVQTVFPLEDGSSVKLTIAQWLTPNENMIDGQGIEPDVPVELTDEQFNKDEDPQLEKAIELLK